MTRIDFYVLPDSQDDARWAFACRLTEKAFRQNLSILIATDDRAAAERMDDLLWRFHPESFLPHSLNQTDPSARISITDDANFARPHDLLINLSGTLPAELTRFSRLAEVVVQTPEVLAFSRKHYLLLKERGYDVVSHRLG